MKNLAAIVQAEIGRERFSEKGINLLFLPAFIVSQNFTIDGKMIRIKILLTQEILTLGTTKSLITIDNYIEKKKEKELIQCPREERRFVHHIHNVMNLTQLYELAPLFNWTDIINKILPDTIEVDDSELVNVGDVRYFGNLTNLLKRTPDRVVANYLMLRGVIQAASFLSKDIRDLDLKFLRTLSGRVTHLPRWEQCIAMVSRSLSYAVSNLYVKHYLQNGSKEKVEVLVRYLRNSFDEMLKGLEWMDDETKKQALKKERAINSYIGYPEELLHDEYISEFYANVSNNNNIIII
ncbi:Phosphate-regulating neutral endopeptidase, partial [Armadillidium vulgare]